MKMQRAAPGERRVCEGGLFLPGLDGVRCVAQQARCSVSGPGGGAATRVHPAQRPRASWENSSWSRLPVDPGLRVGNQTTLKWKAQCSIYTARVNKGSNKSTVYRAAIKGSSNSGSCTVHGLTRINTILVFVLYFLGKQ